MINKNKRFFYFHGLIWDSEKPNTVNKIAIHDIARGLRIVHWLNTLHEENLLKFEILDAFIRGMKDEKGIAVEDEEFQDKMEHTIQILERLKEEFENPSEFKRLKKGVGKMSEYKLFMYDLHGACFRDNGKEMSNMEVAHTLNELHEEIEVCKQAYCEIKEDAIKKTEENKELKKENKQLKQINSNLQDYDGQLIDNLKEEFENPSEFKRFMYELHGACFGRLIDNKYDTFYQIEDSEENIRLLCSRLNQLDEENTSLKSRLMVAEDKLKGLMNDV